LPQEVTNKLFIVSVGFHRYIIENFSGTPDGLKEKEVEEFDPASEIRNHMGIP